MGTTQISLTTEWQASPQDGGARVFVPALARFPPDLAELMALLPVCDINGELLATLASVGGTAPPDLVAGLFCADPFLDIGEMAPAMGRAGIGQVANYPTIQLIDGAAGTGFDLVGYNLDTELTVLARLKDEGFEPLAYVTSAAAAAATLDRGFRRLVHHPGMAPARGERAAAVRIEQLAAARGSEVLRHQSDMAARR